MQTPLKTPLPPESGRANLCAALAAALIASLPATATRAQDLESGGLPPQPPARVSLVAAASALAASDMEVAAGLRIVMDEGWKTYWRSPGEAGFPPMVTWHGNANVKDVTMLWPAPRRYEEYGLTTIGYEKEVIFPLTLTLAESGAPVRLKGTLEYLVCKDICIPLKTPLSLDLATGAKQKTPWGDAIAAFRAKVPRRGGEEIAFASVVAHERAGVEEAQGEEPPARLIVEVTATTAFTTPDLFVEGDEDTWFAAPEVELSRGRKHAVFTVAAGGDAIARNGLSAMPLTLTLTDGARAFEYRRKPTQASDSSAPSYLLILLFAVIGGLILNVMPCVLPVLSLKLLGVLQSGSRQGAIRASFLASSAGIFASFLVLAAVVTALKTAGVAAGWGFQFQQPAFLAFMAALMTAMAANLGGLYVINLPARLNDFLFSGRATATGFSGHGGSFMNGALATLLATPCSAPFLGTAVGFALTREASDIFLVFAALALGFAAPWLAIAAWPRAASLLPRPGAWMGTVKIILALALAATALWLVGVFHNAAGAAATVVLVAALLTLTAALHAWGRRAYPVAAGAGAVALFAALLATALPSPGRATLQDALWRPFDPDAIPALTASGQTVFLDITADWCLTCQFNKLTTLDRAKIREALGSEGVVAMRGDWTRPDERIEKWLARHQRYAIPFNAVYSAAQPQGVVLSELLTPGIVLEALADAAPAAETLNVKADMP